MGIGTFTAYPELNAIIRKVKQTEEYNPRLNTIIASQGLYRFSDQLFEEHPEIEKLSGAGTGVKIVSSIMTMYGGSVIDVTLQFNDSLLGVVQDKFGEDVSAVRTEPDKLVSSVQVQGEGQGTGGIELQTFDPQNCRDG